MQSEETQNLDLLKAQMALASMKAVKNAAKGTTDAKDADQKRWKTSLDFEAMFMGQMYKAMRKSVIGSELTEASPGREIFTEMLDQEYAKLPSRAAAGDAARLDAAHGMSSRLASQIYRSLLTRDGAQPENPAEESPFSGAFSAYLQSRSGQASARRGQSASLPESALNPIVEAAARTYGVAENLIKSVIKQESNAQPRAVSSAGAKGLMQIMDSTAKDLGLRDAFDPKDNVMAGTRYLKQMLDRFHGDEKLALAAYNAGPSMVERFKGVPPIAETRDYVEKVLQGKRLLDAKSGR